MEFDLKNLILEWSKKRLSLKECDVAERKKNSNYFKIFFRTKKIFVGCLVFTGIQRIYRLFEIKQKKFDMRNLLCKF
jgi:hypothetical protein